MLFQGLSHLKVMAISRSTLFSDQDYFQVKVIPESDSKCLDFYPEAGGGLMHSSLQKDCM